MMGKKEALFIHITLTREVEVMNQGSHGENHYACLLTLLKTNCIKIMLFVL